MTRFRLADFGWCAVLACALSWTPNVAATQTDEFALSSPAFEHDHPIPLRHTAYDENISPALTWTGSPEGTRSYALILEDSSIPGPIPFVHWVIYNLPADLNELPEGIPSTPSIDLPSGASQGPNGVRHVGYFGPRPPPGEEHRYNFRLLALRSPPTLPGALDRNALMQVIQPHVIAEAVLTGSYLTR